MILNIIKNIYLGTMLILFRNTPVGKEIKAVLDNGAVIEFTKYNKIFDQVKAIQFLADADQNSADEGQSVDEYRSCGKVQTPYLAVAKYWSSGKPLKIDH